MQRCIQVLMAFLLTGCGVIGHGETLPAGRFVYRSEPQDVEFEISVPGGSTGTAVAIPFSARSLSGKGPSPDGQLQGVAAEGLWSVSFTDSFGNTGKGTIMLRPGLVFLTLKLEQTEEPRCSRFYGSMRLVKQG